MDRNRYRQSPRGAWCYYSGTYHTTTARGYSAALADARAWGYVTATQMADVWGVSPRHARRMAAQDIGPARSGWIRINLYTPGHVSSVRRYLKYPNKCPETVISAEKTALEYEGEAEAFLVNIGRKFRKAGLE